MKNKNTYPRLVINLKIIKNNAERLVSLAKSKNVGITAITKGVCGDIKIAKTLFNSGITSFGDSRIENIKKLKSIRTEKILIRTPMLSEVEETVKYCDISYNSEIEIIRALSKASKINNTNHKIIIMIDMGDLREGVFYKDDLLSLYEESISLDNLTLLGFGFNMKCFGAIIPTQITVQDFLNKVRSLSKFKKLNDYYLSGGNSSSVYLLNGGYLDLINNLRLGESLILGTEAAFGQLIEGCRDDAFILEAEIIEAKYKPSVPIGKVAKNAFNKVPKFIDRGIIRRIICSIGSQDIDFDFIIPVDSDLEILGGSSDHCIINATNASKKYKVGDIIKLKLSYMSVLRAMTSPYVKKEYFD